MFILTVKRIGLLLNWKTCLVTFLIPKCTTIYMFRTKSQIFFRRASLPDPSPWALPPGPCWRLRLRPPLHTRASRLSRPPFRNPRYATGIQYVYSCLSPYVPICTRPCTFAECVSQLVWFIGHSQSFDRTASRILYYFFTFCRLIFFNGSQKFAHSCRVIFHFVAALGKNVGMFKFIGWFSTNVQSSALQRQAAASASQSTELTVVMTSYVSLSIVV